MSWCARLRPNAMALLFQVVAQPCHTHVDHATSIRKSPYWAKHCFNARGVQLWPEPFMGPTDPCQFEWHLSSVCKLSGIHDWNDFALVTWCAPSAQLLWNKIWRPTGKKYFWKNMTCANHDKYWRIVFFQNKPKALNFLRSVFLGKLPLVIEVFKSVLYGHFASSIGLSIPFFASLCWHPTIFASYKESDIRFRLSMTLCLHCPNEMIVLWFYAMTACLSMRMSMQRMRLATMHYIVS